LRPAVREPLTVLHGPDRALYQACEAAGDLAQIARSVGREAVPGAVEEIELRLEPMQDRGLLLKDGARYLSLAVPLGDYAPRPPVVERFRELAGRLGRRVPGGWVIGPDASGLAPRADLRSPRLAARSRPRRHGRRSLTLSQFSFGEAGRMFIRFNPE
jgi:hypothetical protein